MKRVRYQYQLSNEKYDFMKNNDNIDHIKRDIASKLGISLLEKEILDIKIGNADIVDTMEFTAEIFAGPKESFDKIKEIIDKIKEYYYLKGFVDGHRGEEPHDVYPEGYDDINDILARMWELKEELASEGNL